MKLFLDSADLEEIQRCQRWGVLDGVTTTPTFFRRLGLLDASAALERIVERFPGEVHVEALGATAAEIVVAARRNHELGPRVVSKIPIGPEGLEAASQLEAEGVRVNLHLIFSLNQAVLAAKAGASYLCPLLGRLHDAGLDGVGLIREVVEVLGQDPSLRTLVMASSIRTVEEARRAFLSGADAVTLPGHVLARCFESPLTERARAILASDSLAADPISERMRPQERLPVLPPTASLHQMMKEMTLHSIGIVAVVEGGQLVGVVTDGDLRRALKDGAEERLTAGAVMTRAPRSVGLDAAVAVGLELMTRYRLTELIVVDDAQRPVGLLNLHDLMADAR